MSTLERNSYCGGKVIEIANKATGLFKLEALPEKIIVPIEWLRWYEGTKRFQMDQMFETRKSERLAKCVK